MKIDPKQLEMGIIVEMEHTTDKEIAKKIALDHLREIPDYYTRLMKMEREAGVFVGENSIKMGLPQKELCEGRRAGIPEQLLGKMAQGIPLTDREKKIVKDRGKVYISGYNKNGVRVRPQLRKLQKRNYF